MPVKIDIDITSSALEKGLEMARGFVSKLISPALEETGLLIKDSIAYYRLKNQISVLNKAQEVCERNNINPKSVSLKLLCPLLESASLEDSYELQNTWAVLLSNLVDSDQNIENHVFPYVLSQISSNEFSLLKGDAREHVESVIKAEDALDKELNRTNNHKSIIDAQIKEYDFKIAQLKQDQGGNSLFERSELSERIRRLKNDLYDYTHEERRLYKLAICEFSISYSLFEQFELENLIRLGIIKEDKEVYARSKTIELPVANYGQNTIDVDVDLEVEVNYILTRLGFLFLKACTEKSHLQ